MKKLISILLAAVITASAFPALAEHEGPTEDKNQHNVEKDKIVSDIYEGGRREEQGEIFYVPGANIVSSEAKFLMDLGVIDHYHPDNALQRNILKKLIEVIYNNADIFYGYFQGDGAEKEKLTFDEALITLMNITGYASFAELKGGSKADYISVASEYGLLDNIDIKEAQTKFTAKYFSELAYNAINIDMVKTDSNGNKLSVSKGRTLLSDYLKFISVKGIVRANSYTSIIGVDGVGKNNIMIEEDVFCAEALQNVDEFLGYSVIAFVDENNKVRSIITDENKNSFIEFDNDDEIIESTSKTILTYYDENDRERKVKIDPYADLIYNHILCPAYSSDFYVIENGTLRLIDNNGDDKYDVVFRKEYTSFLPLSKNEEKGTVTDRNSVVYDISYVLDGEYMGIHSQNGEPREFKDFTNTTGISVLTQKGTNKVTELIILDKKTYEGAYQSLKEKDKYIIGDKEFEMAQVYKKSCANKFPFDLGSNVLIYLDMFDRIIFAETTSSSYKYAWLIKMLLDDGAEDTVLRLFTEDDVINNYQLAPNVNFNGAKCNEADLFEKAELYDGVTSIAQLIQYKINKDGYISGIRTADKQNCFFGARKAQGEDGFQMNLNFFEENKTLKYYGNDLNSFAGKYYIDADKTVMFGIPTSDALEKVGEEDAYKIMTSLELNKAYKVNLFDVDYEYRIGAATISVGTGASQYVNKGYGSHLAISSGYEWDEYEGEVIGSLHALSSSGTWSANLKCDLDGYYGNQLSQDYSEYKNFFTYAYPESKKVSDDPTVSVRDKIKEEYAKYAKISDIKPGTIFKYTTLNNYVAFYNIEFMIIPDMPINDHFFEFFWRGDGETAHSDLYDDFGNLLEEYEYHTQQSKFGLSKTTFWGREIIAFGQVTEKFIDGFVFNAHVGEEDESEWNRRISALPTKAMNIYYYNKNVSEQSTVAELQAGDYVFINMVQGKLQGITVFRDLPNM